MCFLMRVDLMWIWMWTFVDVDTTVYLHGLG